MANILEDTVNVGFGLFAYSREKLEDLVEKLVDNGKVEKKDARTFLQELADKGNEQRKAIKQYVKDEVHDAVSAVNAKGGGLTKEEIREIVREEIAKAKTE
jgi:polyhydroxyalkanoate synthesis regulator phasin